MKDIVISTSSQKREFLYLAGCFILAVCLNITGIIAYKTNWKELYTQWFTMLILTVVIYFLLLFVRLAFTFLVRIFRKKN
jgi:hypothetical protein